MQLITWICNGHGANCSDRGAADDQVLLAADPLALVVLRAVGGTSFGHTYKGCAIISVQGAIAGACTPLVAY